MATDDNITSMLKGLNRGELAEIPFPKEGFEPSLTRTKKYSPVRAFFDRAWKDYQSKHPEACITDKDLVMRLRTAWMDYIHNLDTVVYHRSRLRNAAAAWYRQAKYNPDYKAKATKDA